MALHLIKMAVGIESVSHLRQRQQVRLAETAGALRHVTRHTPKRSDEILAGGSIYWVIKGFIRARQRVVGFDQLLNAEGRKRCAIMLDPDLFAVSPQPFRPFQGWRYLDAGAAPADLATDDEGAGEMPEEMMMQLRELGLL